MKRPVTVGLLNRGAVSFLITWQSGDKAFEKPSLLLGKCLLLDHPSRLRISIALRGEGTDIFNNGIHWILLARIGLKAGKWDRETGLTIPCPPNPTTTQFKALNNLNVAHSLLGFLWHCLLDWRPYTQKQTHICCLETQLTNNEYLLSPRSVSYLHTDQ